MCNRFYLKKKTNKIKQKRLYTLGKSFEKKKSILCYNSKMANFLILYNNKKRSPQGLIFYILLIWMSKLCKLFSNIL